MTTRAKPVEAMAFLEKLSGGPLTFAKLLWSIRLSDEIIQTDFARKLGISRAHLCDIEKGRKHVAPGRAAKFARILGYPVTQFVRIALSDLVRADGLKLEVHVA
jgi:antitoxin HigA-1